MNWLKNSWILSSLFIYSGFAIGQQSLNGTTNSFDLDSAILNEEPSIPQFIPPMSTAQLLPGYKVALKKGMFEILGGIGHIDSSKETDSGKPSYIKSNPQTDMFPIQFAYGITDTFNIAISTKIQRIEDKVRRSNNEGYSEPQISASYTFKNERSAILLSGTYTPDMGPKTSVANGISRIEGNTFSGGASGEFLGGGFFRLDPIILGGEASYLYRETRILNRETMVLYTGQSNAKQFRFDGGNEKTIRGIIELAMSFRLGMTFGKTWIEEEQEMGVYDLTPIIHDSYFKTFLSAYGRFQINPRLSLIPSIQYNETPDTTSLTNGNNQDLSTQVNLRYRF